MKYRFHHLGIPTTEVKQGERYSATFKMYTSDHQGLCRIQFRRFEAGCPLHPLITSTPHVALQVDDINTAIQGYEVFLGPYEPIDGYKEAIINDNGMPIEFIQTTLTDEELWGKAAVQQDLNV